MNKKGKSKIKRPFWQLVKIQGKLTLREPYGIIFGIGLPVFLFIIIGSIPSIRSFFKIYIPGIMVTVLIMIGLFSIPIPLVRDREIGWLRRISTTPISPVKLLAAQVAVNSVLVVIAQVIMVLGTIIIFGMKTSINIPSLIISIILLTSAMFSLGFVITAFARSQSVANGMAQGLLYPLLFFAGMYIPMVFLPKYIQIISSLTPVGSAVNAISNAMEGEFPSLYSLLVLIIYSVTLSFLAIQYFQWE